LEKLLRALDDVTIGYTESIQHWRIEKCVAKYGYLHQTLAEGEMEKDKGDNGKKRKEDK
jgi:hypothetical protein